MKHLAIGWACTLKDLFIRFPYKKCKTLFKKRETKKEVRRIFTTGLEIIVNDIIENGTTFKLPGFLYYGGEIHFEPVTGDEFIRVKKKGKFKGVDFLQTLFTGYQLYFYSHGKRDRILAKKKVPIYLGKKHKEKIEQLANEGKTFG